MASLNQFTARARQIAEGRGVDPFKNPIIDAGMTTEALVPHCIRFAFTKASNDDVLDTAVDQAIEMTGELGVLPDTVLRGHLGEGYLPGIPHSSPIDYPDYPRSRFDNMLCYWSTRGANFYSNCTPDYGELIYSTSDTVQKTEGTDTVSIGPSDFVALNHVGLHVVITLLGASTVVAIVEYTSTPKEITLRDYVTGDTNTAVSTGSSLYLYNTGLELIRSGTCGKSGASQIVVDNTAATSNADVGRLFIGYNADGVTVLIRAIIGSINDADSFNIIGYSGVALAGAKNFEIYRIVGPTLTLNTPSIPIMPSDPAAEIPLTSKLTDDAILILAGVLTGEISIKAILGIEEVKESE